MISALLFLFLFSLLSFSLLSFLSQPLLFGFLIFQSLLSPFFNLFLAAGFSHFRFTSLIQWISLEMAETTKAEWPFRPAHTTQRFSAVKRARERADEADRCLRFLR